jgi:hypothetical protein
MRASEKTQVPSLTQGKHLRMFILPMTLSRVDLESAWVLLARRGVFHQPRGGFLEKPKNCKPCSSPLTFLAWRATPLGGRIFSIFSCNGYGNDLNEV